MISAHYDREFEIKRPVTTSNGGLVSVVYQTIATIRGKLRPLSGNERHYNEKNNYETTHRLYCDVMDIRAEDKIIDLTNGRVYDVKYIKNPMELDRYLMVDCKWIEEHEVIETIVPTTEAVV